MSHKFRLTIDLSNAAFGDGESIEEAAPEVARILRAIAEKVEEDGVPDLYKTIWDINGNNVGSYAAKPADYR